MCLGMCVCECIGAICGLFVIQIMRSTFTAGHQLFSRPFERLGLVSWPPTVIQEVSLDSWAVEALGHVLGQQILRPTCKLCAKLVCLLHLHNLLRSFIVVAVDKFETKSKHSRTLFRLFACRIYKNLKQFCIHLKGNAMRPIPLNAVCICFGQTGDSGLMHK